MFRNYDRIIIYDFETNGTWSPLNQPIQVCMKIMDKGEKPVVYKAYIKCPYRLNSTIIQLTGITDEILAKEGRDIKVVFREIAEILFEKPNTCLIGYNSRKFDGRFLDYYLAVAWEPTWPAHLQMKWDPAKVFDVIAQFKADLIGLRQKPDESLLEFEIRCANARCDKDHSLSDALVFYGIKHNGKFHTADQDVEKTEKVFKAQVKRMLAKQVKKVSVPRILEPKYKKSVVASRAA